MILTLFIDNDKSKEILLRLLIPEGGAKNQDLIDAVITSSQKTVDVKQKDGSLASEQRLDEDTIWTKLLHVNSNNLGQAIFELQEWERNAMLSTSNMCTERGVILRDEAMALGISIRRAIDAKSAETIGINSQNSQTNLLGMIGKNKQERVYTMKDNAKSSIFDSIMGRKAEQDDEE